MSTLDVYARISDDRTGQRAGTNRQVADASALVEARGHTVGEVHVDNDISASRYSAGKSRPAFDAMLARVRAGVIDGFAAFHTDRLYRRNRELEDVIDIVEKRGLVVLTCEGDFDLGSADGRMVARVLVTMAAKESDDKSRRLTAMHRHRAAKGEVSGGGRRPFGFEADRMTVRLEEAVLIREAAERVLAGESLRSICADWREAGVETVTGARWQTTTLRRLLCSGRIAGMREHHGSIVRGDDGQPVATVWPAIITPEQSSRLRAILLDPARLNHSREPTSYLLSGIVHCARCDVPMTTMPHKRKGITYRRYVCRVDRGGCDRNGISAERIEEDVVEMLRARMADDRARRETAVASEEQSILDAISAAEAELDDWARELAEGTIGREAFRAASKAIESRIERLRGQLRRQRVNLVVDDAASVDWPELGFDRQVTAARHFIEKISVTPTTKQNNRYDPTRWLPGLVWRSHGDG